MYTANDYLKRNIECTKQNIYVAVGVSCNICWKPIVRKQNEILSFTGQLPCQHDIPEDIESDQDRLEIHGIEGVTSGNTNPQGTRAD
jgi:hypothetical protein